MHLKRRLVCPPGVSAFDVVNDSMWQRKNRCFKCIIYKRSKKYHEKLTICKCGENNR